jgi:hypothetical protein
MRETTTKNGQRKCNVCQRILPLTNEFFAYLNKAERKLAFTCKDCKSKKTAEFYKTHPHSKSIQIRVRKYFIQYNKRKDQWSVFRESPWKWLIDFKSKEEAIKWLEDK